ncbi:hypothetical protein PMI34_02700 [Pseudomonas sp. GM74]|nr:hypothetical protein PMI34_02700 [Pseudomonas sp. GM74]
MTEGPIAGKPAPTRIVFNPVGAGLPAMAAVPTLQYVSKKMG